MVFVAADADLLTAHVLPIARAAGAGGLEVAVIAREGVHRTEIEGSGARFVPLDICSSGLNPMTAGYAAGQLSAILKALKADIVHAVGLRSILVGGTAAAMAGIAARVYAVSGPGTIGDPGHTGGRISRFAAKTLLKGPLSSRRTRYLFDRAQDAHAFGLDPADVTVTLAGETEHTRAEAALGIYADLLRT